MARRSLFVAIAAIAAALLPASAYAATPGVTSAPFASPVTFQWAPTGTATEQLLRATGACPGTGATPVASSGGPLAPPSSASDAPGEGVFCYRIQDDPILGQVGAGVTVTVDTLPPTATVAVGPLAGVPNYIGGAVTITGTQEDTGSGVASSALFHGPVGACATGTAGAAWDTTASLDGAYDICNVVADNAGHSTTFTSTVVVDNANPFGSILTPAAGAFVSAGTAAIPLYLTTDAGDATAGVATVQWQRSPTGTTGWVNANGGAIANPANGYRRNWNTTAAAVGDGADYLRAVITDRAGHVFTTPVTAVTVDNTNPDAAAVVTAPPAVAGSPTLSWTPAHDAVGIDHYEVRRGATANPAGPVIGTVASTGAGTYSYPDANAPDQQTSYYTVRAFDATGHFVDSASAAVLVDSRAQSAPQTLAAPTPTASAPALNWKAPPVFTVDHYDVYRDGLLLASTVGPATTYVDAGALEGVHDYAVLARSPTAQPGVLSSSFKVLLDKTAPISGGAPTAQVLGAGGVLLAWPAAGDALSGVAGYLVRRTSGGTPPAAPDAGTAVCTQTATTCTDAGSASGTWSYGVFARDGAGNVALIGTVANVVVVDNVAPLAPTKLSLVKPKAKKPGANIVFTLSWVKPTALDLDRVLVVLNLKRDPTTPADGKAIYKGLGTSTKVTLRRGQTGYLALFAYDHTGNVSLKPARTVVKLASLIPLRPLNGSIVRSASPRLTWKAKLGTSYYNVQVFLKGKRVLTGWPSQAAFRIPKGKLEPGTYVWYVWPANKGKRSSPTFGKLIGRATFTYKK
jgi:hypothetical protein